MFGFRDELRYIELAYGIGEFTSAQMSDDLVRIHLYDRTSEMLNRVTRPNISADLCRIEKMGFLKSKRVSREVVTKTGKKCHKSFQKMYSLNRQGMSYLAWLTKPTYSELAGTVADIQFAKLLKEVPPEEREFWMTYYRMKVRKNSGDRRFATWDKLREKATDAIIAKSMPQSGPNPLIQDVAQQKKEIERLKKEIELLKSPMNDREKKKRAGGVEGQSDEGESSQE